MKDKKIVITGGAGFIGSNMAGTLSKENKVTVIDNLSTGHIKNIQDFIDSNEGSHMIRFVYFFNYTEGISLEDSETWYLTNHVSAVKELPGITRFRSWKQWDAGIPYPSPGAPTPFDQFVRRTELCFVDRQ